MEGRVVSNSTLRRPAQRDFKRTLQQISEDYNINLLSMLFVEVLYANVMSQSKQQTWTSINMSSDGST